MACTNPRIMAVCDVRQIDKDTGEVHVDWPHLKRMQQYGWKINFDRLKAYRLIARSSRDHPLEHIESWSRLEDMEIPCGNCIQCRLDYSKTWAIRCSFEAMLHKDNYFITLTYDEDKLPIGSNGNPTLVREHLSTFINSLRKKLKRTFNVNGLKFFGCGEYGPSSFRPHLHVILFGCPIPDLSLDFYDEEGNRTRRNSSFGPMYFSQFIKDLWPYGFITIEDANYNTEAYVSRYIMKKQKGKAGNEIYINQLGVLPPFLAMSNRPAIGALYFEEHEKLLIDEPSLVVPRDGKEPLVAGLPRYFKKKILENHPELYKPMLEKAKDATLKARSLLKGIKKINDDRADKESHLISKFEAFGRDSI